MKKLNTLSILLISLITIVVYLYTDFTVAEYSTNKDIEGNSEWITGFFDDLDSFNNNNWQDQRIWVKHESRG